MISHVPKQLCCGCHACYSACPEKCISMQTDGEGFWYPVVDGQRCIECGLCQRVCPIVLAHSVERQPEAYACRHKEDNVRMQSSSGGVFSPLAEKVLYNGGAIFGAVFNKSFCVVHDWTDNPEQLYRFRGSKYVQSRIGDTYIQAKHFLLQKREVLFSGTPCQIAGLKAYLGQEYENLICLDLICHGVPSPLVWELYRKSVIGANALQAVNFRDKTVGWKRYSVGFELANGNKIKELNSRNNYLQGFLSNVYLRPSCYRCKFKTLQRQSDITLADFWGIENVFPHLDDDWGISLVIVNSPKGAEMFSKVADTLICQKADLQQAIRYNPSAICSVPYNAKRAEFFRKLPITEVSELIADTVRVSIYRNSYLKMRQFFSRILSLGKEIANLSFF